MAGMSTPLAVRSAQGAWQGQSKLHLSWLPEEQRIQACESRLTVEFGPDQAFATVAYTWAYDGEPQAGMLVVAGSEASEDAPADVSGGWTDSWHQSGGVMALKNAGTDDETLRLVGEYSGGDTTWGWRIELDAPTADVLRFRMINVDPEGNGEWAVDAEYRRS
jgi:hypothetical protein